MTVCIIPLVRLTFLPIINHLEQLHRQNFVHGDIRAYNMVLQYDTDRPKSNHYAIDEGITTDRDTPAKLLREYI